MDKLVKKAFQVHDALRECVNADVRTCRKCAYFIRGCRTTLMLDAAKVIGRLIEETQED